MGEEKMPAEKAAADDLPGDKTPDKGRYDRQPSRALLPDRGVVAVSGPQAGEFLHGLVTNNVRRLAASDACYAALLTPQGKVSFDFLIVAQSSEMFLLDCPRALAADLARRLTFYKLRAKVEISDRSDTAAVVATWGGQGASAADSGYRDPRDMRLGWRAIVASSDQHAAAEASSAYDDHRIRLRIPHGGLDFIYSDTFPHDANIDLLHGIDFNKGCYVGQEVIARVHHRGSSRKRIARVFFTPPAPAVGTPISLTGSVIGVMGSATGHQGLAMIRVDKAEAAGASGEKIIADEHVLRVELDF
jgi:tRNA-modifying protein YgfZ